MQARNVITFQESVHDELPVTGDLVRLAAKQDLIAHPECIEILPDLFRPREIGWAILRAEPDQATGLPAGQFGKAVVALVETREGVGSGQGKQSPVHRIGPCVVGADKLLGTLHLGAFHQPGAAVSTYVEEYACRAVAIARD